MNESHEQLRKHFGPEAILVLKLVRDPEVAFPNDFLFVNIRTSLAVDDAMGCLDRFDEAWYLDLVDSFGGVVNFNLEFHEL